MSTVYSLICWGGRTGKIVTLTDAGDIVNSSAHGLRDGTPLQFASGTMPSGLALNTTYYSKSTGINAFTLYTTDALTTQVTWTGSGAGPFVLKSKTMLDYMAAAPTRWGGVGSERIYAKLTDWKAARTAAASYFDKEICEIGEAFSDIESSYVQVAVPAQEVEIVAINGASHNGVNDAGYILEVASGNYSVGALLLSCRALIRGFTVKVTGTGSGLSMGHVLSRAEQMRVIGNGAGTLNPGLQLTTTATSVFASFFSGFKYGVSINNSQQFISLANCTFTKNGTGVYSQYTSNVYGFIYNNLSVGNTTANWSAQPTGLSAAGGNAGASGDPVWVTGGNSTVTLATTDFVDYTNGDYRPALSSSPQVDSGAAYYDPYPYDISGDEVPNYNNGGAEAVDVGCYEFDHGYGPHPASHVLTLTNVVTGSRVHVSDQAGTVVHYDDIAAASTVAITQPVYGDTRDNWRIRVRKASDSPAYQPYETLMTATAGSSSLYIAQIQDE